MGPDIRGLLLCGGRAARFGSDKMLADVKSADIGMSFRQGLAVHMAIQAKDEERLRAALQKFRQEYGPVAQAAARPQQ